MTPGTSNHGLYSPEGVCERAYDMQGIIVVHPLRKEGYSSRTNQRKKLNWLTNYKVPLNVIPALAVPVRELFICS